MTRKYREEHIQMPIFISIPNHRIVSQYAAAYLFWFTFEGSTQWETTKNFILSSASFASLSLKDLNSRKFGESYLYLLFWLKKKCVELVLCRGHYYSFLIFLLIALEIVFAFIHKSQQSKNSRYKWRQCIFLGINESTSINCKNENQP